MLDKQKEYVILTAKEITLKLMEKLDYTAPANTHPPNLTAAKNYFEAAGENYKVLVTKVGEALKSL
ncbi:MAG: hypothetical protein WAK96_10865 [Desulfobaccales bacterium]